MSPPMFFWIPDSELAVLSLSIASMDSCIIFLMSKIRTRLRPNCTPQWDVPTGISMTTSSMGAWIWVTQHQGLICQHWRWFLWSTTASCTFCFQVQLLHPKHMLTFPYRTKFCKLPHHPLQSIDSSFRSRHRLSFAALLDIYLLPWWWESIKQLCWDWRSRNTTYPNWVFQLFNRLNAVSDMFENPFLSFAAWVEIHIVKVI
jgi:hypothetical protein